MWPLTSIRNVLLIQRRSSWTRQQVLDYQKAQLREMLHYVWSESPFYRDYFSAHGVREAELDEIGVRDLPIVTKETLMENFDRISKDPVLRREPIEAWIHAGEPGLFQNRYVVFHTSGSSGTLGIFVYDKVAWCRMRGVTSRAGSVRINPFNRVRLAWYGATHGRFAGVTSCSSLPKSLCKVRLCSVLEPLPTTIDTLNRFQPEHLFGYAASIHKLATAALEGKLRIHPKHVSTCGEKLTDAAATAIREAWDITPTDAYGTSESLCLALRMPGRDCLELMEDETIIEMLDNNDNDIAPGEIGRVVITTLYNRTIPVLRYEMRDYVTRGHRAEHEKFDNILRVEGRVNDALPINLQDGTSDTIHPVVLSEFFVPGIRKFQFISESPGSVMIKYMSDTEMDDEVREEFERILAMKGATGATKAAAQRVPDFAADRTTGKHRLVVLPAKV